MDNGKSLQIPTAKRHFKAPINPINPFLVLIATLIYIVWFPTVFVSLPPLYNHPGTHTADCSCYNRANLSTMRRPSRADGLAKERLRWTQELHDQFEQAVNQLGGPDSKCRAGNLFIYFSALFGFTVGDVCVNCGCQGQHQREF